MVSVAYAKEKLMEWHPDWNLEKLTGRQILAVYRKEAARVAQAARAPRTQAEYVAAARTDKRAAQVKRPAPQYKQLTLKFEEVKEVKSEQTQAPPAAQEQDKRQIAREQLRQEVLRLAQGILEKKGWPRVKTHWRLAWGEIIQDRTPGQGFLRAIIKLARGTLTLVESNPTKVTNPANKVMLYWETKDSRRVGQVRRVNGKLEVIWFD